MYTGIYAGRCIFIKRAFRVRLFRAYALLMSGLVFLVIASLFVVIFQKNRENAIFGVQEKLHSEVQEVTNLFDRMRDISLQVLSDQRFVELFVSAAQDTDREGNYFEITDPAAGEEARAILQTINTISNSALRISAYNDRGDCVNTDLPLSAMPAGSSLLDPDFLEGQYQIIADNGGGFVISGPHPDYWAADFWEQDDSQRSIISFMCYISPPYSDEIYGVLDIQYDKNDLAGLSFFAEQEGSYAILLDNYGRSDLTQYVSSERSGDICEALKEEAERSGRYVYTFRENGRSYIAVGEMEPKSNWMLVRVVDTQTLDRGYAMVYVALIAGGVLLLAATLLVVQKISRRISAPLNILSTSISAVKLDAMHALAPLPEKYQTAELDELSRAFNGMLARLDHSFALEMKAYGHALRSQMDPHFLYNALALLSDTADVEGSRTTVRLCEKLSAILRYQADQSADVVLLRKELQHARNYLEFMSAHYEGCLFCDIHEEEALADMPIPHMTLQPILENCFKYAFKMVEPPWKIRVRAEAMNGAWQITIADNGCGIAPEKIQEIYARIEQMRKNIAESYSALHIGGMGLVNTVLRLWLQAGETLRFELSVPPEGGTIVLLGGKR